MDGVRNNEIIIYCTHYQHSDWLRAPSAYFENSHDFVDKHGYSIISYPITGISADYIKCINYTPLAKECEHLNGLKHLIGFAWCICPCILRSTNKIYSHFTQ